MIKVYRVEHKDFENGNAFAGPYSASGINNASDWADFSSDHGDDNHPPPDKDLLLKTHNIIKNKNFDDYFFGFNSLDQLKLWFSNTELKRLFDLNYVIAEYISDTVIEGEKQVLFIPQSKRIIVCD